MFAQLQGKISGENQKHQKFLGATKQQAWEKLCLLCGEQKPMDFGAFQCFEHSTSSLVKTGWFYFPLFSAGVCFRNGQSQFSTSDSICTSEQEGNSFWEPPRNLLFPQQVHGNWWLSCILECHHHIQSFSVGCFVMLTCTLAGKSSSLSLCVCPIKPMCTEHLEIISLIPCTLCAFTSDFPWQDPFWMSPVVSILSPLLVHW